MTYRSPDLPSKPVGNTGVSLMKDGEWWIKYSPHCRSGCPTQDHKSYADCCKGIQINTGVLLTSSGKSWEGELQAYRDARSQGIQPTGTTMAKVQEALDISDATGVAYQGDNPYG